MGWMTLKEKGGGLLMLSGHENPEQVTREKAPGAMLNVLTSSIQHRESAVIVVDETNIGPREGTEIAQLYIPDEVISLSWVDRELKEFQRIFLPAGATRQVSLEVDYDSFALVDAEGWCVVEPGCFKILLGPSSLTQDLLVAQLTIL